jgi:hypothetical protein
LRVAYRLIYILLMFVVSAHPDELGVFV